MRTGARPAPPARDVQTVLRPDATVREAFGYPCDLCHATRGVRVVDTYWACEPCERAYLERVEFEREPSRFIRHA